jgi:hypothetical protein
MLVEDVKIGYWLNGKFIHSRTTTRDAATTLEGACGGPRLDPGSSEQRWHELEPVRDPLWSPAEVAAQYDRPGSTTRHERDIPDTIAPNPRAGW